MACDPKALEPYESLNRSWKSTCRILLGEEIGDLKEYEAWLSEHRVPMLKKRSSLSQQDVYCAVPDYSSNARFLSLDEVDFGKKFDPLPLDINDIKDIDSLINAISERFMYCGNVVLGKSKYVDSSSDIQNSVYVLGSNFIYDSEYVAFSSYCRGSRHLFATVSDYGCSNLIRVFETHKQSRCFEAWKCYDSSDIYFCCSVEGSQDALFSFNQRNKRHLIGNICLARDKYLALKKKLLGEILEELKKDKRLPSLMEIINASEKPNKPNSIQKAPEIEHSPEESDMEPIEEAFRKTTSVVLGKPLHGIGSYGSWLRRHVPGIREARSAWSGKKVYVSEVSPCMLFPKDRIVDRDEYWQIGEKTRLDEKDIISLDRIKASVGKIGFVNPNGRLGDCKNLIMVPLCNSSVNCYHCPIASYNENAAFCYWPRTSKFMFGSCLAFSSSFCINSYYSTILSRAFETDASNNCSDVFFVHNCENVHDSMFCFNAKNLRNAIGNSRLGAEEYKKAKSLLLSQIADELEAKKELKWDIFNIAKSQKKV